MSFRIVTIKTRCKLELSLNYLVYRGEEEKKVLLDEISTLIIASTEITITAALLSALSSKNINVIFCDARYNPQSQLLNIYGTNDSFKKIQIQFGRDSTTKCTIWKKIVKKKIYNQYLNLNDALEKNLLLSYYKEVQDGDITNREGHAAKVYFNSLFGKGFARNLDININNYLDYGYSILLSAINREIKSFGYLTEIGIHHIGETNPFNLSCDLIEPLRPLVDSYIIKNKVNDENFKKVFIDMLAIKVKFQNNEMYLENAIHAYVKDVLFNLKQQTTEIDFIDYEL